MQGSSNSKLSQLNFHENVSDWIPITNGEIIVKIKDMSTLSSQFYIKTKPGINLSNMIAVAFLSEDLENLGNLKISTKGIEFEIHCSADTFTDRYNGTELQSGIWSFQQTNQALIVRYNDEEVYLFATDDDCLREEIKAIEFEEKLSQTSVAYSGDIIIGKFYFRKGYV